MKSLRFFPVLLLLSASGVPYAAQAQIAAVSVPPSTASSDTPWAFERSDLPVDPSFRFGRLDNGMRFIIRPNGTPRGQAVVQLWIDAGSLAEAEEERGLAHFIEHMAFNGSTNIPEGEMVRLLEREGLAFGADTNAATGFESTVYKLNLPRNDPDLLDTALMLMRETASELTFAPEAVEREKGVILSERRVRDTYEYRNLLDQLRFFYPEARFPDRLPIGTAETIADATPDQLRDLWQRAYRPGNAAVVVVGDFDTDEVEQAIRKHFGDWQEGSTVSLPDAGPVDPGHAGMTSVYIDPALPERITATRSGPWLDEDDTVENRRVNVLRQIGYGIVNRRLTRLSRSDDPPFRSAGFGTSDVFEEARSTNLIVDAGEGEWEQALAAAVREYRRAFAFGFTEAEVAEQIARLRTSLENAAAGATTRSNRNFVSAAIALLEDEQVPTTPESALERFVALEDAITPDAVLEALRVQAVPLRDPLLRFEGRTAPEGGAEAVRAAWDAAWNADVENQDGALPGEFAYTDFGPAGEIVSDTEEPVLGIRTITFANGLKLNLKRTDLQEDRISVQLNIDGGLLLNTKDDPLATAMTSVLPMGGLGKHSYDELDSILAGRSVGFSIATDDDTFRMAAGTTPRDLELQLQVLAAAVSDPGYRPQGEAQYRRNIENFFARRNATPNDALGNALGGIVSDNDPRFTLQPKEDYLALGFSDLRNEIDERLREGALELALVGDIDEDRAIDLIARTLGALPEREPDFRQYADNRQRSFTEDRGIRVVRHGGPADQALLRMTWPTTDDRDFEETIRLELLQRIVQVRLTDTLREELGETYSPGVNSSQSRVYEGYGTFNTAAAVSVDDLDPARNAMLETIRSLIEEPVDQDVLLRARRPLLEAYDNALKTNGGWMALADRAQSEPQDIERFTRGKELVAAITPEDIRRVASRYLDPEQRLEINVLPERPQD
ncbi:M16 family metallopeptidase [Altericroceibacterium xinjiangense]|uniref:M16 family metallopeptidase n=1 Tax=Altericroceibacterium xinjiangense TaxID=762261 RepID=UPI000F7F590F|nr:insulinase family protein [Altericroceibacterium xinjiangense]